MFKLKTVMLYLQESGDHMKQRNSSCLVETFVGLSPCFDYREAKYKKKNNPFFHCSNFDHLPRILKKKT